MDLAQKIQKNRRARGMTQEELAAALNVSHQSISKWETGQTMPGLDKILLLSEYFGVATDYLLKDGVESDGTPPPLPPSSRMRAAPAAGKSRYWLYSGILLAVAGGSGILLLWILSLLNPPYTFGKMLGHLKMFLFYVRYNEIEALLTLAAAALSAGAGIVLLCRFRQKPGKH